MKSVKILLGASLAALMMTSISSPVFAEEVTLNGAGCFPVGHPVKTVGSFY